MIKEVSSIANTGTLVRHLVKSFVFNGGEVQASLPGISSSMTDKQFFIYTQLEDSKDIMELLMVTDAIRRYNYRAEIDVHIPYVPYARQDRVMQEGEALSIAVMANLINSQNYAKVIIWDAHSDVTTALKNNCVNFHVKDLINPLFNGFTSTFISEDNAFLVAPDAGSIKKISEVSKKYRIPMIRADKHRDVKTGKITETIVYSDHVGDKDFLIVDDICDGGRTFIELAAKLKEKTTGKVYLYVTHGIFANGLELFEGKIDKIFCPNVFSKVQDHPLLVRI
jgi:ribose-phosphate pyrophosphokinase